MSFKEIFTESEDNKEIVYWMEPAQSITKETEKVVKSIFKKYNTSEVYTNKGDIFIKGNFSKKEMTELAIALDKITDFTQSSFSGSGKLSNHGKYIFDNKQWRSYDHLDGYINGFGFKKQPGK